MPPESYEECKRKAINRLHRIQGQLAGLERKIEADEPCENIVIQARAVEKATVSFVNYVFQNYLIHQIRPEMDIDPDQALQDIGRIFKLVNQ